MRGRAMWLLRVSLPFQDAEKPRASVRTFCRVPPLFMGVTKPPTLAEKFDRPFREIALFPRGFPSRRL
jgi:hypothetical protein